MTLFIRRGDPFREAMTLRDAMNRLIEDSFVRPSWTARADGATEPALRLPLDAYSTQDAIIITASVPGLKAENVEITLEGDSLTITGEMPAPLENVNYFLQERAFGRFSRELIFNVPVDADKATASFENGVLTVTVPKAETIKPRTIKISQN